MQNTEIACRLEEVANSVGKRNAAARGKCAVAGIRMN